MKKLSNQIYNISKNAFKTENKQLLYRIISGWEEIIDHKFVYEAVPVKLSKIKDGYIIWIEASSHSISTFLFYQKDIIIERISNFTGINNIKSVKISVFATKELSNFGKINEVRKLSYSLPKSIENSIEQIEDQELSLALKRISEKFIPFEK